MTTPGSAVIHVEPTRHTRLRGPVAAVSAGLVVITAMVLALTMRGDDVPVVPAAAAVPEPVRSQPAALRQEPDPPSPPRVAVDADIESAPAGAEIVVDGEVLGTTPFHGQIPRSDRDVVLVIRLAGYLDRPIAVRATEPIHERVELARTPPTRRPTRDRDRSVNPFD
jgi:hypothetical protein